MIFLPRNWANAAENTVAGYSSKTSGKNDVERDTHFQQGLVISNLNRDAFILTVNKTDDHPEGNTLCVWLESEGSGKMLYENRIVG